MTRKPLNYWKNIDNIVSEAEKIMQQNEWDILPSAVILRKHNYTAFVSAIDNNYPDKIQGLRKDLGDTQQQRKENGYWQDIDNIIVEAEKAMKEQNWEELPSSVDLVKYGYSSLSKAIDQNYEGKIQALRKFLGGENKKKSHGYWHNLENIEFEIEKIMLENDWDEIPTARILFKHGYSNLITPIHDNYPGGIRGLRKKFGSKGKQLKLNGYWKEKSNIELEARKAMNEQGWDDLPSHERLRFYNYNSLSAAIGEYYPGKTRALRNFLGCTRKEPKPPGYWQNIQNIITEAKERMLENNWNSLPSTTVLKKYSYSTLAYAIDKYYPGKIKAIRNDLAIELNVEAENKRLEQLLSKYMKN